MFDEDDDDGTELDLQDLDLLLESELQVISNGDESISKHNKERNMSLFDDSVEIDFSYHSISENTVDAIDNTTCEWTELLQYSSEFIHTVQCTLKLPNTDDNIKSTRELTEESGNDFILSAQTIEDIISSLAPDENKDTVLLDNLENSNIGYEIRQILELMITSVECCAPIYLSVAIDALPPVKTEENLELHIIEDDNLADTSHTIITNPSETRQQIHDDTMSEMNQLSRLSKSREERDAACLERDLEMELQQALEQDRKQRLERRLRFEKEAAEASLRKKMAVINV